MGDQGGQARVAAGRRGEGVHDQVPKQLRLAKVLQLHLSRYRGDVGEM